MKTGTIITLLAVGGVGYLLYRQWKKTGLAVAAAPPAIAPLTPYQERTATEYAIHYGIPIETMVKLVRAMPEGAWGPIPGIY